MLRELKHAHAEVRACLHDMEALTSRNSVEKLDYTRARFLISKANMRRRLQFTSICVEICKNASRQEAAIIDQLKAGDRALMGKSAAHAMQWTSEAVGTDWPGYREASRQIRRHMSFELDAEEGLLFPSSARSTSAR